MIGLTEKINLNEDLKEMVLGAVQVYGGSVVLRLVEELVYDGTRCHDLCFLNVEI